MGEVRPGDEETRPAPARYYLGLVGWYLPFFPLGKILGMNASLGMLVLCQG